MAATLTSPGRLVAASAAVAALSLSGVSAQMAPVQSNEQQPAMPVKQCNTGACWDEPANIVMDMNWRWMHNKDGYNNCLTDAGWDKELCPDPDTCAKNCMIEGVDKKGYTEDYKAQEVDQNGLKLTYPKAPRVYMTEAGGSSYKLFKLLNKEFSFDVDLSTLPCGLNAALYFIEMPANGDMGIGNMAGAKYGTGYCDAQCPKMKMIKGKANMLNWTTHQAKNPDGKMVTLGPDGSNGICCAEMDLLEANTKAAQFTAHPCKHAQQKVCSGDEECGNKDKDMVGWCDKDGCGFNSYQKGNRKFWGAGKDFAVDTTKPVTVITQFITSDGTDFGELVEIRQKYVQDGKVIENSKSTNLPGGGDSITDKTCDESQKVYNASKTYGYHDLGGLKTMGEALGRGMVLSMSIWDDNFGRMLWLDADKPSVDFDPKDPGVSRGPCAFDFGTSKDIKAKLEKDGVTAFVTFSNIKYGQIGTTVDAAKESSKGTPGYGAYWLQQPASLQSLAAPSALQASAFAGVLAFVTAAALLVRRRRNSVASHAVEGCALLPREELVAASPSSVAGSADEESLE